MTRNRMLCFLLTGLLLGPCVGLSRAGPITWQFTGEVTFVGNDDGLLGDLVVVGSPFVGSITFESETPDSRPDDPHGGRFDGALIDISGSVGLLPFSGPTDSTQFIAVMDDDPLSDDGFNLFAEIELFDQLAAFQWIFRDGSRTVFSSDELPIIPIDVDSFDVIVTQIVGASGPSVFAIGVDIAAITPEPGSLALLLMGLALVGRRRVSRSS